MEFDLLADYWVKLKENKKPNKYLNFVRELKKYGAWKWQWYQIKVGDLETFL